MLVHAQGSTPPSAEANDLPTPQAIVDLNTLQKVGNAPFHLKMSLQFFDLDGKSAEQGTMEYWWAGRQGSLLSLQSPSIGNRASFELDSSESVAAERFISLAAELLDAVRAPGAVLGLPKTEVSTESRTIGASTVQCMRAAPLPTKFQPSMPTDVCYDSASEAIRLVVSANHEIVRNRPARFLNDRVAIDTIISWESKQAISGHIEQLESFDPSRSMVKLEGGDSKESQKEAGPVTPRLAGGVMAGRKVSGGSPEYPYYARQRRLHGSVILLAKISKQGRITNLVPLASPDTTLTKSVVDAVSKWTYQPYLLNGEPTEVNTTITVNFNLD